MHASVSRSLSSVAGLFYRALLMCIPELVRHEVALLGRRVHDPRVDKALLGHGAGLGGVHALALASHRQNLLRHAPLQGS